MVVRRVFILPDNSIRLGAPAKPREEDESDKDYLNRVIGEHPDGLPYFDVPLSDFPTDKERSKWRWDGSRVIHDPTIEIQQEKIDKLTKQMDDEIAKASPSPIKIVRLMRQREKLIEE